MRKDFQGRPQYRIYCAVHSRGQQEKDARAAADAAAGHNKALTAAQDRAAREEARQIDIAILAGREEELMTMSALRVNFESVRMLLDQTKRREKLKKQLVVAEAAARAERLQNPAAALAFLERLKTLAAAGLPPAQQAAEVFGGAAAAPAPAALAPAAGVAVVPGGH